MSIEAQLVELQEYAAKEKLEIVASFQEAQAAKEPGRTKFAQMLSFLQTGKIGKGGGAAPLKTAKEPGEKHRLEPYFNFGGRKFFNHKVEIIN